jgi:ABC-type transporter Mla MlaB component
LAALRQAVLAGIGGTLEEGFVTVRPYARGFDDLEIKVQRDGRQRRILALSGALNYYTAERLPLAYQALLEAEGRSLRRLVLDLHHVIQFDATGAAALLEVARDADTRPFEFLIDDRPDRPAYIATGLRQRLKFLATEES